MVESLAVVLANGELEEPAVLRSRLHKVLPALVVAADGGARHAAVLGLTVDLLVGDLDSIPPSTRDGLAGRGVSLVQRPADKDETDLELALLHVFGAGTTRAVVVGATGGRLDMTIANVQLLLHPSLRGRSVQLWAADQTAYLVTPPGGELLGAVGDGVSLIPIGGEARGVTTHDLAFPLTGEILAAGPARGVSNRVSQPAPRVELEAGTLLVVHTPRVAAGRQGGSNASRSRANRQRRRSGAASDG